MKMPMTFQGNGETGGTKREGRLLSLDVLRGFDMLFIMGFAGLVTCVCQCLGYGADFWLVRQMGHPEWFGFTHHDTIFPLFLFIAGVSFPFSFVRQVERGATPWQIRLRCVRRGLVLFALGLAYGGLLRDGTLRLSSVLGRIGFAWMFAALLFTWFRARTRLAIAVLILVGYWVLTFTVTAPDHPDAWCLSKEGNISCWVDRMILFLPKGRLYDNQSTLGLFPAIVTALLGMFAGEIVRKREWSGNRRALVLAGASVLCLLLGLLVAYGFGRWSFPVHKKLWSPSFVLVLGCYSYGLFALFYWLIDVKGWWRRTLFFRVIGMNSITIYLAQAVVPFTAVAGFFFGWLAMSAETWVPGLGPLVGQIAYIGVCWGFLYFLYRKSTFLKV